MSKIQSRIAAHDLLLISLEYHYFARKEADESMARIGDKKLPNFPLYFFKPNFPKLFGRYLTEHGWKGSEDLDGDTFSLTRDVPRGVQYRSLPMRSREEEYLVDLEKIVKEQAREEARSAVELMNDIFAPFKRAEQAYKRVMKRPIDHKRDINQEFDKRKKDAEAAWEKAYESRVSTKVA